MKPTVSVLIGAMLLFALAGSATAQESSAVEPSLQEQLGQLNSTMQEIVTLLRQQIESQETSLLIKRVELSGRTLIAKKEQLRKAKSEAVNLADEEATLVPMIEAFEKELDEATESNPFSTMQITQMEQRLESVKRQRRDLTNELMVLENDVNTAEEDMAVIESVLDDRLGLR